MPTTPKKLKKTGSQKAAKRHGENIDPSSAKTSQSSAKKTTQAGATAFIRNYIVRVTCEHRSAYVLGVSPDERRSGESEASETTVIVTATIATMA